MIERSLEHENETPAERAARREANRRTQAIGGRFLAAGYNWLIFPEGGTKKVVKKDGRAIREKREPGVLLPLRNGFVYSLESMTEEERRKVKMLGIAAHFSEGRFSNLHPTIYITRPEAPIEGTGAEEKWLKQGEDLLGRGLAEAVRLHDLRK
jgi:hypothetical protein